jgi:hypothetical protein
MQDEKAAQRHLQRPKVGGGQQGLGESDWVFFAMLRPGVEVRHRLRSITSEP